MTLIENILKKVQSKDSFRRYASPPPELDEVSLEKRVYKKKRKPLNRYRHVRARVDSAAPRLQPAHVTRHVAEHARRLTRIYMENFRLLVMIKKQYNGRGKVDCHWDHPPKQANEFYDNRKIWMKKVDTDNKTIYERIQYAKARVETTASHQRCWVRNRRRMVSRATLPFVLFPPQPAEDVVPEFRAPPGVRRPRVRMSLRVEGGACFGWLTLELFTDVCPLTCRLFAELLHADASYTYIGSRFFTKVPHLYWSGGDVVHDNGSGCYLLPGRRVPLGAENYHFPHSMPGLVSMRMTCDDEMCGIFNITFKALPQFDLKNVVFARVVRPSSTYDMMTSFGSALSTQPAVRVEAARVSRGEDLLKQPPAPRPAGDDVTRAAHADRRAAALTRY